MEMLLYLALGAVLYGFVADRTDRAVDREMRKRRTGSAVADAGVDSGRELRMHRE